MIKRKATCVFSLFYFQIEKDDKAAARKGSTKPVEAEKTEEPIEAVTDGSLQKVPSPLEASPPIKPEREFEVLEAAHLNLDKKALDTSSEDETAAPSPTESTSVTDKQENETSEISMQKDQMHYRFKMVSLMTLNLQKTFSRMVSTILPRGKKMVKR